MNASITRRLLGGSAIVVSAFLGLAGISIDRAYHESAREALNEQLQAHVYTLLAAAGEDAAGRPRLPDNLGAPAFNRPDSGLYAQVSGERGAYRWRSGSLLGRNYPLLEQLPPGATRLSQHQGLLVLQQGLGWDDLEGNSLPYVFSVAIELAPLADQQTAFRQTLWRWLGGSALLLLLIQLALVRWGLQPLHRIALDVRRIEQGHARRLEGPVPRELDSLTRNMNSLIAQGQARQERLRHALADLAHSLKTPLAVLRGLGAETANAELARQIDQQTARIDQIVSYQRQRLAVAGSNVLAPPVAVEPIVTRICAGLQKVYQERDIRCDIRLAGGILLRADQGDLFELFGNLLENAFKYTRTQVRVSREGNALVVEDDGQGIAAQQIERVMKRGERADRHRPGEGIGLAVVQEIVRQYAGSIRIDRSPLGGARVAIELGGETDVSSN